MSQDWALALNCMLLGPERRSKSVLEEIVGATDGGAEVYSQIAVGRVRTFLSQNPWIIMPWIPTFGLIDAFSSSWCALALGNAMSAVAANPHRGF